MPISDSVRLRLGSVSGVCFLGYCLFEVPSNSVLHSVGATLDRAHHDQLGCHLDGDDVRSDCAHFLCVAVSARRSGGGFLSRCGLLPESLVSGGTTRARNRSIHDGGPSERELSAARCPRLLTLNGSFGLAGWQWLFLVEGVPAILLGVIVLGYLTDRPEMADWLSSEEKDWLVNRLATERLSRGGASPISIFAALTNRTIWHLGIIFLFAAIGFYGYSFWAPLVVKSLIGASDFGVGLILGAISAVTIILMLLNSAHSDHTDERRLHVAISLLISGAGFFGCAVLQEPILALVFLALVPIGHCAAYGPFWSMPSRFLTGAPAAAGIALVVTIANVGGLVGPTVIGALKDHFGTHGPAFMLLGGCAVVAALLSMVLGRVSVLRSAQASDGLNG